MDIHSICSMLNKSVVFTKCVGRARNRFFKIAYLYSIGYKYGLCEGHFMILIRFASMYAPIDLSK